MERFARAHLRATPWKNGGGTTREIISSPRGSGLDTFAWRASIADVSADGPFSIFSGVDRVLVLLEGDGVVLRDTDGQVIRRLDAPFMPFEFSGDDQIASSLLGGPSVDFNVMTRRAVARAEVQVVRTREELVRAHAGVLFAARGQWDVRATNGERANAATAQAPLRLDASDGCWWGDEALAWRVAPAAPGAVLLAVRIHANNERR